MSKETYTINASRDERPGTPEQIYTAIVGVHPYLQYQCAQLALFNRYGSGKKITITDLFVKDMSTPNSTSNNARFLLQKVSAWVLGGAEEKDEDSGHLMKMDSSNADLPAEVKVYEDVQSVTLAEGPMRRIPNLPFQNVTRALGDLVFMGHADKDSPFNSAQLFRRFNVNGDVQPLIIREGEGLCITPENGYIYLTVKYWVNIFIRDVSSGECYVYNVAASPDGGRTSMLFVNGTGSGKTYQVFGVEMAETGDDLAVNIFSLEKIESLDVNTGRETLPIAHDSANGSLTGVVDCRMDCDVTIYGNKHGAIIIRPIYIRDIQTNTGGAPYLSGTMNLSLGARNPNFLNIRNCNSEIVLREGEGVAMFKRTSSQIGKASVAIRFTVENAVETPAGGNTYSRSRLVNV